MSRRKERNTIFEALGSLGWPLLMGSAACSVFYILIYQGPLNNAAMHRYFASHPVAVVTVAMFFVGLSALLLKLADVLGQCLVLPRIRLGDAPQDATAAEASRQHLQQLAELSTIARQSYLGRRLHEALQFVRRRGSADGLDDELKYLADMDAGRQQESYALARIVIWATPMLGFLGTVIGITKALGDLNPSDLASSPETAMEGLMSGLYVAFDTTALALSLSIVLMFLQFIVDRIETQLLGAVDRHVGHQLSERFEQTGTSADPHVASIQRMSQAVIKTVEQLVQRQATLWNSTIEATQQQWDQLAQRSGDQLQSALVAALDTSLQNFAQQLVSSQQTISEQSHQRYQQWQTLLSDNARLMRDQQSELVRQGEIMKQVAEATGDVITLEKSLNENLNALAGAKNFEDTVMSLSAAIHLLNSRMQSGENSKVELTSNRTRSQAA